MFEWISQNRSITGSYFIPKSKKEIICCTEAYFEAQRDFLGACLCLLSLLYLSSLRVKCLNENLVFYVQYFLYKYIVFLLFLLFWLPVNLKSNELFRHSISGADDINKITKRLSCWLLCWFLSWSLLIHDEVTPVLYSYLRMLRWCPVWRSSRDVSVCAAWKPRDGKREFWIWIWKWAVSESEAVFTSAVSCSAASRWTSQTQQRLHPEPAKQVLLL